MADTASTSFTPSGSRSKAIVFIGLSVALMAVGSWITIPFGPVPMTLQMFVIPLLICVMPARWATAATYAFIILGGIGVPLFAGFKGGLGVLMGPTGGFLLGYLIGVPFAAYFLQAVRKRLDSKAAIFACEMLAGLAFTFIAYVAGWVQYAAVAGISMQAAFAVSVAPFIIPDVVKVLVAVACAAPIRAAIKQQA